MIQIEFFSIDAGWISGQINVADVEYYFHYSYITNFLDDLLKSLLYIDNQLEDELYLEHFIAHWEPAIDDWYFVKDNQKLSMTIKSYEDESRKNIIENIVIECDYYEFVDCLIQGLTLFIKKIGLYAYHIEWGEEFPLSYYLKLKDICQKEQRIHLKELTLEETYGRGGRVSNIFEELELFTQIIREEDNNENI